MKMGKLLLGWDLGKRDYQAVWTLQHRLQQERIQHKIEDSLLLVEHPSIYTMGRSGQRSDVVASAEFLQSRNIEVLPVDRGGKITYHGPGQLVGYPIFHLKENHRPSISWYVWALEEVFIQALSQWGLQGRRIPKLTGVWVGDDKITALGVRMSRWVTMHGFSFNVAPDLSYYRGIVPCGIADRGVTSLQQLLPQVPSLKEVKKNILKNLLEVFSFEEVNWDFFGKDKKGEKYAEILN